MSTIEPFLGTWRLLACEARNGPRKVQHRFGANAIGQLVYDERGHMSAHVMDAGRPLFDSHDPAGGTDREVRSAFEGHVSYYGTYTVDPVARTVTHHLQGASYPNWIGRDLLRYFRFSEDRLVLSTPPLLFGGTTLEYVLTWERVHPPRGR